MATTDMEDICNTFIWNMQDFISFWIVLNKSRTMVNRTLTVPVPSINEVEVKRGYFKFQKPVKRIVIRQGKVREYWRHLGNFQNNLGGTKAAMSEARKTINNSLSYMVQRRISPEAVIQGYNTKIKPK